MEFDLDAVLEELGYAEKGWETDGYGISSNLIAPDGCMIEQDGECPHGYVSPLREQGLI